MGLRGRPSPLHCGSVSAGLGGGASLIPRQPASTYAPHKRTASAPTHIASVPSEKPDAAGGATRSPLFVLGLGPSSGLYYRDRIV